MAAPKKVPAPPQPKPVDAKTAEQIRNEARGKANVAQAAQNIRNIALGKATVNQAVKNTKKDVVKEDKFVPKDTTDTTDTTLTTGIDSATQAELDRLKEELAALRGERSTASAAATAEKRQSVYDFIRTRAEELGIGVAIADRIIDLVAQQGYSLRAVDIEIQTTPEYKARFAGIEKYKKNFASDIAAGKKAAQPTPAEYIERVMRQISFDIIDPLISEEFTPKSTPAMPIIGVHSKEQSDAINLIKTFYLKFPQYRWFTFRDLRGLSEKEFANSLRDCFLSVWIDDHSGFGTFPLESMKSNVPVIGKVPNLSPDWMSEENGIWVTDQTLLPDLVADYAQNWLEDNIDPQIFEKMKETVERYTDKQKFESTVVSLFEGYLTTRADSFENQISKTEE